MTRDHQKPEDNFVQGMIFINLIRLFESNMLPMKKKPKLSNISSMQLAYTTYWLPFVFSYLGKYFEIFASDYDALISSAITCFLHEFNPSGQLILSEINPKQ